jgi:hypothetical protein
MSALTVLTVLNLNCPLTIATFGAKLMFSGFWPMRRAKQDPPGLSGGVAEQRDGESEAQCLGGLEVDDELDLNATACWSGSSGGLVPLRISH